MIIGVYGDQGPEGPQGPPGADGRDGEVTYKYLDGQVMRLSNWNEVSSGTKFWAGNTRVGDDNNSTGSSTAGTYYLDIVNYGGDYYKCISNTSKTSTTPDNSAA